jgi:phosphoglycolate phosphatase-like HAD superfamily hydrolase
LAPTKSPASLSGQAPGSEQGVSVVLLDVDNTLCDWVDMWSRSFGALLHRLAAAGVGESDVKAICRRQRSAEYRFLAHEIPETTLETAAALMVAYVDACDGALRPYPTVVETLADLKARGCLLVGCTGARAYYAAQRVRVLGLDGILDYLYSREDHAVPAGIPPASLRRLSPGAYALEATIHRCMEEGMAKPDPRLLLRIVDELAAPIEQTIFVGDSLTRDIVMAQEAGVTDVHARYGSPEPEGYALLSRFSHWTAGDLEREQRLDGEDAIRPTFTLTRSFDELAALFRFVPFSRD